MPIHKDPTGRGLAAQASEVDVLIVGGGPVGLALACELGSRGVATLLVDAELNPSIGPRAQLVNIRSLEILRRWGIADELRAAAVFPKDWPSDVVFCTGLGDRLLKRFPAFTELAAGAKEQSPEAPQRIPQFLTHQVLRRHAEQFPSVTCLWGWRAEEIVDGPDGATTRIVDAATGAARTIASRYVAGCDGGASLVRTTMDIPFEGIGALSQQLGIFFDSPDLVEHLAVGPALMYLVANPKAQGLFGTVDGTRWWFQSAGWPLDKNLSDLDPLALVRDAIGPGAEGLTLELAGVQPWTLNALVARSYGAGRLFVAGDAAHLMPPTGGHNMNTGIGDAVDLGWKLAAVIQGWGGAGLLDSYDLERRPVAKRNAEGSARNAMQIRVALGDALSTDVNDEDARSALGERMFDATRMEWVSIGVVLGYRYEGSPVSVPDGTAPTSDDPDRYIPTARPGSRAPHGWIAPGRSTLDLFGVGFTLLDFGGDEAAVSELSAAAERVGLPLRHERISDSSIAGLYERKLVLVRPDGHVAWRGDRLDHAGSKIIDVVRGADGRQ